MNLKNYCVAIIPELKIVLHLKKVVKCPNHPEKRIVNLDSVMHTCPLCQEEMVLSEEVVFEIYPLVKRKELFLDITNDQIIEMEMGGCQK